MTNRVVVTGLGLMTGLGLDLESSWRGLLQGRSAVARFRLFEPQGLRSPCGVELPEQADELFASAFAPRRRAQMTRGTMMAVLCARQAMGDAGLALDAADRSRVAVVMGTTGTGYVGPREGVDEHRILRNMSSAPAAWISLEHKITGPAFVVGTACSSGGYAIETARALVAGGSCDAAIAGAADSSLNPLDVQGFGSLMALAEPTEDFATASRPFDRRRSGFVMGEGGGVLVLEAEAQARRRGARIYAVLQPAALTSEAYNIISPKRDGAGMAEAMRLALQLAGLGPADIDYINAHGTSTQLNDRYEAMAVRDVFGEHARTLAVSSTKSMTGHCLAAAAGVEAAICCKALGENVVPPTANLTEPDPELGLDFVPLAARPMPLRHVMSNSFAFGGHNAVNIFSRVEQ